MSSPCVGDESSWRDATRAREPWRLESVDKGTSKDARRHTKLRASADTHTRRHAFAQRQNTYTRTSAHRCASEEGHCLSQTTNTTSHTRHTRKRAQVVPLTHSDPHSLSFFSLTHYTQRDRHHQASTKPQARTSCSQSASPCPDHVSPLPRLPCRSTPRARAHRLPVDGQSEERHHFRAQTRSASALPSPAIADNRPTQQAGRRVSSHARPDSRATPRQWIVPEANMDLNGRERTAPSATAVTPGTSRARSAGAEGVQQAPLAQEIN